MEADAPVVRDAARSGVTEGAGTGSSSRPTVSASGLPVDLVADHLDELRAMAQRLVRGEAPGHSRQATGLVNEMWIRLREGAGRGHAVPTDRDEFLAFAARAMRNILIEWARRRKAIKRGGDRVRTPLDERQLGAGGNDLGDGWARALLDLDDEVEALRARDSDCAEAFILRFYGGLTDAQIGGQLSVSPRQAGQLVRAARAALRSRIFHDGRAGSDEG